MLSKKDSIGKMESRRVFLKKIMMTGIALAAGTDSFADMPVHKHTKDASCTLYRSVNGTPEKNLVKIIEMMGGIEKLIGADDVVIVKPNVQWWNHGATNLSALNSLVDLIMERPGGFQGEVVIAENCHFGHTYWTPMIRGWSRPFQLNSDIPGVNNMNDLCGLLKRKHKARFSLVHWIDVATGSSRVFSPADGDGYVYCDGTGGVPLITCDNGATGEKYRTTIMTYPIFSTDKGTKIDFKNGVWEKGKYSEQHIRFINFAALNHHSTYCGVTSAVKNYLGVADLSGGSDPHNSGRLTGNYYNFHSFPFDKWSSGPKPGMIGKAIGTFMNTVRKADMNITAAEWIGVSHRTMKPAAHTRAILACTDPVALDYHAAKYLLYPNSKIEFNNPDNKDKPFYHYLLKCSESTGFALNEEKVKVTSYDWEKGSMQKDDELTVLSEKRWGTDIKGMMRYLLLRYLY